jgi:hypothetical protein
LPISKYEGNRTNFRGTRFFVVFIFSKKKKQKNGGDIESRNANFLDIGSGFDSQTGNALK